MTALARIVRRIIVPWLLLLAEYVLRVEALLFAAASDLLFVQINIFLWCFKSYYISLSD